MDKNYITLRKWAEMNSLTEEEGLIVAKAQKEFVLRIKGVRLVNPITMDRSFSSYIGSRENAREMKRQALKENASTKQHLINAFRSFQLMGFSAKDMVELNKLYVAEELISIDKIKESVYFYATARKANMTLIDLNKLTEYLAHQGKTLNEFIKEIS